MKKIYHLIPLFILRSDEIDVSKEDASDFWLNFICSGDGYKIYPGNTSDPK